MTRWQLHVPDETDRDVRRLLAQRGFKKGDLSRFVVDAVRREVLKVDVAETRASFADLTPAEADQLANDALAWARARRT